MKLWNHTSERSWGLVGLRLNSLRTPLRSTDTDQQNNTEICTQHHHIHCWCVEWQELQYAREVCGKVGLEAEPWLHDRHLMLHWLFVQMWLVWNHSSVRQYTAPRIGGARKMSRPVARASRGRRPTRRAVMHDAAGTWLWWVKRFARWLVLDKGCGLTRQ